MHCHVQNPLAQPMVRATNQRRSDWLTTPPPRLHLIATFAPSLPCADSLVRSCDSRTLSFSLTTRPPYLTQRQNKLLSRVAPRTSKAPHPQAPHHNHVCCCESTSTAILRSRLAELTNDPSQQPTQILCGVNCACAPISTPTPAAAPTATKSCSARESCAYAQSGQCACGKSEGGQCSASQAKQGCAKAKEVSFGGSFPLTVIVS